MAENNTAATATQAPMEAQEPMSTQDPDTKGEVKTYTEEEVQALLAERDQAFDKKFSKKFAEYQKKAKAEADEAARLAEMNAQQKAEYERDQLQSELNTLKAAQAKADMVKSARSMLAEEGFDSVPDGLLSAVVTEDAESTQSNVEALSEWLKAAVEAAVRDSIPGSVPRTGGTQSVTKEEIMKIKDRTERQAMINKHRELF